MFGKMPMVCSNDPSGTLKAIIGLASLLPHYGLTALMSCTPPSFILTFQSFGSQLAWPTRLAFIHINLSFDITFNPWYCHMVSVWLTALTSSLLPECRYDP